jgi:hypothetical protein
MAMQVSIYTETHQLMGTLETSQRRLTHVLIHEALEALVLRDCLVVSLHDPNAEDKLLPQVQVSRAHVLFAVQHSLFRAGGGTAESAEDRLIRVQKVPHPIGASIAGWDVRGNLHLVPDAEIMAALRVLREPFLPLTDAHALYVPNGRVRVGPETVIFHRAKVEMIWPEVAATKG